MTSHSEISFESAGGTPRSYKLPLLLAGLSLATLAALIVGNGNPAVALAPVAGFLVVYALTRLPLRVPALILIACGFIFENPSDQLAEGKWESPVRIVGALLFAQLKHVIPVGALVITGFDVVLVLLAGIYVYRRSVRSTIDTRGAVSTPRPLVYAAWASLLGCAFSFVWGMAHGGVFRFSLWQIQRVIYVPLVFLLLQAAIPHAGYYKTIGRIIIGCACFRAALAIYIRGVVPEVDYATTHHDSMLFAVATFILLVSVLEVRSRGAAVTALLVLPLLVWGMIANDRRLVWAELGVAIIFVFIFMRRNKFKVRLVRGLLYAAPVFLAYMAAGWGSQSQVFAPVAMVRSIVDSDSDSSTQWRDLENFNLVSTLKKNPVIGSGLGRPFDFVVAMPDVTAGYELEPYAPHNSMLGLWTYNGYIGFALHWMVLVVAVYFSMRSYRAAADPRDRAAALSCFCAIVVYMVHLYGDMALGTWVSIFLISSTMVISGKLAVSLGAWPGRRPHRAVPGTSIEGRPASAQ
jgi:hypothetical protein